MGRRPRLRFSAGRRVLTWVVVRLLITALVSLSLTFDLRIITRPTGQRRPRSPWRVRNANAPDLPEGGGSRLVLGSGANGQQGAGTTRDDLLCDAAQQVAFEPGAPVGRNYYEVRAQFGCLLHDRGGRRTDLDDDLDVEAFELAPRHFAQLELGAFLRLHVELRGKARIRRDRGRQGDD